MSVSTVILKPTRRCNAGCTYCSSPPVAGVVWDQQLLQKIFSNLQTRLHPGNVTIIWHGGEPMLLGPEFYLQAKQTLSNFRDFKHSLQSNILLYDQSWDKTLHSVFNSRLSTSFEPCGTYRRLNNSPLEYSTQFLDKLEKLKLANISCAITGVYFNETVSTIPKLYDFALEYSHIRAIRVNHGQNIGRAQGCEGILQAIDPEALALEYHKLYTRWIHDRPNFIIQPFHDLLQSLLSVSFQCCPWTANCFGKILAIEPDGSVCTCSEQADLDLKRFRLGNIFETSLEAMYSSSKSTKIFSECKKAEYSYCRDCDFFTSCGGGCRVYVFQNAFENFCVWKSLLQRLRDDLNAGNLDWYLPKVKGY